MKKQVAFILLSEFRPPSRRMLSLLLHRSFICCYFRLSSQMQFDFFFTITTNASALHVYDYLSSVSVWNIWRKK